MIEYIKTLIISFITGLIAPVATSSSAAFVMLEDILDFSSGKDESVLYFSIISLVFSLVSLFFVRKIYAKGFKAVFSKQKKSKKASAYKTMMAGLLISLIPALVMIIPVGENKFVLDFFTDYLWKDHFLVTAFCCFAGGFILILARWCSKQQFQKHRNASGTDVLRFSIYQILSYIFPGLSHISLGAAGFIVSGVDEAVVMRDLLIYSAPSAIVINVMRIIRVLLPGTLTVDVVKLVICVVSAILSSALMINIVSKLNIRKNFMFFSIYSICFGVFMLIASLFIL